MFGDVLDEISCFVYQFGQCDFEYGLCLYLQSYDDKFDWIVVIVGIYFYGIGFFFDYIIMINKGISIKMLGLV